MHLWEKGTPTDPFVLAFTTGDDPLLDNELLPYDLRASAAHAEALFQAGILDENELKELTAELEKLEKAVKQGHFQVRVEDEDGHTALENALVEDLGDLGKKLHAGRSRNDQVLVSLRLYLRDHLEALDQCLVDLSSEVHGFIARHGTTAFPGYTHTRPAMPTSLGMWAGALVDAVADDRQLLSSIASLIDQNPLGTGAGYGVPLTMDRQLTTTRLGFRKTQFNPIYAQHSRPKFEALVLHGLAQVLFDLNRFASDFIFFTLTGYLILPDDLTTGSSIMPQKRNPDLLELVRAHYHFILARQMEAQTLPANLIFGYHRDFQLLKPALLQSFPIATSCIKIITLVFSRIQVDEQVCQEKITPELMATERVYDLVREGVPFRDAYRQVAKELAAEHQSPSS